MSRQDNLAEVARLRSEIARRQYEMDSMDARLRPLLAIVAHQRKTDKALQKRAALDEYWITAEDELLVVDSDRHNWLMKVVERLALGKRGKICCWTNKGRNKLCGNKRFEDKLGLPWCKIHLEDRDARFWDDLKERMRVFDDHAEAMIGNREVELPRSLRSRLLQHYQSRKDGDEDEMVGASDFEDDEDAGVDAPGAPAIGQQPAVGSRVNDAALDQMDQGH
jgi:hypothetical protein